MDWKFPAVTFSTETMTFLFQGVGKNVESSWMFLHRIALGEFYNTVCTVKALYITDTFCGRSL